MEVWGGLLGEKLAKDLAGEGERSGLGTGSGAIFFYYSEFNFVISNFLCQMSKLRYGEGPNQV